MISLSSWLLDKFLGEKSNPDSNLPTPLKGIFVSGSHTYPQVVERSKIEKLKHSNKFKYRIFKFVEYCDQFLIYYYYYLPREIKESGFWQGLKEYIVHWDPIYELLISSPAYKVETIFRKIKRVVEWSQVIWKDDAEYDYVSIFFILEYKLERLRERLENSHHLTEHQKLAEIEYCLLLLERIRRKDYDVCPYLKQAGASLVSNKQSRATFSSKYQIAQELYRKDVSKLFEMIEQKHEGWWS